MKHLKKALVIFLALTFSATAAWAEQLVIKGSTTVLPIAQKVAEAYMKEKPEIKISISGGGSGNGIKAIIDGTTDIGNASRFIKGKEVKLALERGSYPVPFRVAYDCIVPVVHPSNTVENLTLDALKMIYEGKYKNWNEVGGPDKKIVVISRDTSSGTYEVWEKKVMDKSRVYPGALLQASNGAVVQAVAKNKYAVGYIGLGYVDESLVKPVKVDGVMASVKTALNGSYPISRGLNLYTAGQPTGEAKQLIDFIMSPAGQKLASEVGYVPVKK